MTELHAAQASLFAFGTRVTERRASRYSWHAFDLVTGLRGPRVVTEKLGTVGRRIGEPTDLSGLGVRIDPASDWRAATEPGRSMMALLDEDTEQPLWAGMVTRRHSDAGDWVSVDLVTHEGYFDRRYTGDHTYSGSDQATIAADLLSDALAEGVQMTVDAPLTGQLRERTYASDEDKTVLSALDELAGIVNGIEWTVDLQWADNANRTALERVVRVRARVGVASTRPPAVFAMPGAVTDFKYLEDYSAGSGANEVRATSSGEGDTRPESSRWQAVLPGWPVYEHRFTPSTSIVNTSVLDSHAQAELEQTWDGLKQLELTARASAAPRLGEAWSLGDDVAVQLTCPRFPARLDADGALVSGYAGIVRAVGWEYDLDGDTVKPLLLEVTETDVEAL